MKVKVPKGECEWVDDAVYTPKYHFTVDDWSRPQHQIKTGNTYFCKTHNRAWEDGTTLEGIYTRCAGSKAPLVEYALVMLKDHDFKKLWGFW